MECNRRKGPNIAGIDPTTRRLTRLFNPRSDMWNEHFAWRGARVEGLSDVGRTTVAVLNLNRVTRVRVRKSLIDEGVFPPVGDRVQ